MSLIGKLFGTGDNPPDATKLDGATMAALARSLSALLPDERGWITFAEARNLFSTERAEYAFGIVDHKPLTVLLAERNCAHLSIERMNLVIQPVGHVPCPIVRAVALHIQRRIHTGHPGKLHPGPVDTDDPR